MILKEAETVVSRTNSLVGFWLARRLLILCAGGLLCMGCWPEEFRPQPVPKIDPRRELLYPVKIKIHPFSSVVRRAGGGNFDGLIAAFEAQDRFGDPIKAMGVMRFEVYKYALSQPANRGPRVGYWPDIRLNSLEAIQKHWDSTLRLYRFTLKWQEQAKPRQRFILEATLTTPEGRQLSDSHTLEVAP